MDSQAIITLLRLNREAIGSGGEIKLLRPRQVVKRFMDIGRVLELFERYETKVEAIRSFRKSKHVTPLEPVNPNLNTAIRQKMVLLRLIEILLQKKTIEIREILMEISR